MRQGLYSLPLSWPKWFDVNNNLSTQTYDLIVVGSGAAGLSAAVTTAYSGLKVLVLEKADVVGGATAWSGGWLWVPGHPLAAQAGIHEDWDALHNYLRHELKGHYREELVNSFLQHAGPMVEFFHTKTALKFDEGNAIPDIHGGSPGAAEGGHQVIAAPFKATRLDDDWRRVRRTMRETSFLGMPIQAGRDLRAFLTCTRSLDSAIYVAGRLIRHAWHMLRYGRSMHWVNGQALIGRLLRSAIDLGVEIHTESAVTGLVKNEGRIRAVRVSSNSAERVIETRYGVVLAAGGFSHDKNLRQLLFPKNPTGEEHWPLPPADCNGDGIRLGQSAGGCFQADLASAAAWAPVSIVKHPDGTRGHFPHIIDRAKPGVIGVLADGQRFVNEADGYYDYVSSMITGVGEDQPVKSWLIADHCCVRRYGLGIVRPWPIPIKYWIKSGYLKRADTLEALAYCCGIDAQGLKATVEGFNHYARQGEDPVFGRGSTAYNRKMGDLDHKPNPCVAALLQPPFYAVEVVPGSFGTFAGLKTDKDARVLDAKGRVIEGLYAAGTDMASVMGGYYPSGGINLGPAMTFGYIAGRHVNSKAGGQYEKE